MKLNMVLWQILSIFLYRDKEYSANYNNFHQIDKYFKSNHLIKLNALCSVTGIELDSMPIFMLSTYISYDYALKF